MKKSLFFVAAAAVVLASCSSDVTLDENNKFIIRDQDYTINVTFKSA